MPWARERSIAIHFRVVSNVKPAFTSSLLAMIKVSALDFAVEFYGGMVLRRINS